MDVCVLYMVPKEPLNQAPWNTHVLLRDSLEAVLDAGNMMMNREDTVPALKVGVYWGYRHQAAL